VDTSAFTSEGISRILGGGVLPPSTTVQQCNSPQSTGGDKLALFGTGKPLDLAKFYIAITSGNGTTIFVTIVTFLQSGPASTINFCGNVANQFFVSTFMTVNFTSGQSCATIVAISTG
jgi:hypothetical protein